ncbi:serine/threonine-protein kinase [Chiayiivirga flava]|uniref:Serine/threonine-protein kinase n=1 Tax=Chiayiivirga flava TaxID=659595 RepID=A0A7W8FZF9_9GAMM|nr:serine/threonine-protein kinase [Chiayiivirga flava]MBB5208086.1 serine/threonine-protein kinase [Chiayiivirga flava]
MSLDLKRRAYLVLRDLLDTPTGERDACAVERCGDDTALLTEVRDLLATDTGGVLDRTAAGVAARLVGGNDGDDAEAVLPAGTQLGAWRLLQPLGQGGMGMVYLAERAGDGYVQRGALKLIKRGMDSAAVVARFRNERSILSRLTQPNIARLLDGGVAEDGRPFLVMEYVEGEPLSDWAARTAAGLDTRVALFLQVCDAVAHAHRQLVVHRDIKPGNVLVDARGVPKLLDFGIAKLLGDGEDATRTATSGHFLSPAYAAPEQRDGGFVTTAADIYQLGLLLFELLTGARFSAIAGNTGGHPSQRLAAARELVGDDGPTAITPRQLRGDAGIIVARATDADAARRYATVEALADDVRRWRDGRPILARPDSGLYRLRRFVARHRVAAALGVIAIVGLLGGSALALWQAQRAEREAQLARSAQAFLTSVFDAASPDSEAGARVTARELLDRGAERIERDLADQPRLRADMQVTLGTLYTQLGQYDQAQALLERARSGWPDGSADDAAARLRLLAKLAAVERRRGRLDDALALFDSVLATDAPADARSHVLVERALLHDERGAFDAGLADARAALAIDSARDDDAGLDIVRDRHIEALMLARLGRFDESQRVFDATLADASVRLGPDDTRVAQMHNDYAVLMSSASRPEPAEAHARKALDARRRRLGDDHPAVAETLQVLGGPLRQLGRLDEAQQVLEEALAIQRKVYGNEHVQVAGTLNSLGIVASTRQQYALAETYTRESLAIYRAIGSDRTVNTATITTNLAVAMMRQGKIADARPLLEDALALHRQLLGDRHPAIFSDYNALSQLSLREGRIDEAIAHARASAAVGDALFRPGRETATVHLTLANALLRAGRADEALAEIEGAIGTLTAIGAGSEPRMLYAIALQADALIDLDRVDAAAPLAERVLRERPANDIANRIGAHALMARLALARQQPARAQREREAARRLLATMAAPDPELAADIARD